jgi:hypothetical protein
MRRRAHRLPGRRGWAAALVVAMAAGLLVAPDLAHRAGAQMGVFTDERFAGLAVDLRPRSLQLAPDGWADAASGRATGATRGPSTRPAAEQNLSRRVRSVTTIDVGDPIVLTHRGREISGSYPWLYIVEPGNL